MKNILIGLLVMTVVGLGGFIIYDNTISKSADVNSNTTDETNNSNQVSSGKTLDLSNKGLTEIGPDIYNKTDTVTLILSNNQLKSLKSEMGRMTKVEILKLDHNALEGSLIAEIRMMPLKELDASDNNLTGVPAEIGQLSKIEKLDFSNNNITGLPNELENLKDTLETINLSGNPIDQTTKNKLKTSLPNTNIIF